MSRTKFAATVLFFGAAAVLCAVDVPSDTYGSIAEYLAEVYGIDDNEALTTLPVLNVPMGGRSEGMGTAFSAVADDASFIEWNPAGSSMLERTELAFFHNNWIADTKVEGAVFAVRYGNLGLAAGGKWLYLPFTEYDAFADRASKGFYSETVGVLNASYNFLSGYYFSGISLGANLKGAFRFVPDYSDNEGTVVSGSGAEQSTFAPMVDVGMLTRFNLLKFYHAREKNASVALAVRNFGPPALDEPLPTTATAGFAYHPTRPILTSFDFSVPINLAEPDASERPYWATGVSATVTDFLSMRAGLLFKSANLRFSIGSAIFLSGIQLDLNYTLDLLTQLQPFNRISLAARFDFGDGGRAATAHRVDDLYLRGLEEYARGNSDAALKLWNEALTLNPRFDPAREGVAALLDTKTLEQRISDIQRIE